MIVFLHGLCEKMADIYYICHCKPQEIVDWGGGGFDIILPFNIPRVQGNLVLIADWSAVSFDMRN